MPQRRSDTASPGPARSRAAASPVKHSAVDGVCGGAEEGRNRVHILMCSNALFLQHTAVCLVSLLVNNPELFFDITVVGRTTEQLDEDKLRRSLARFPNHLLSFREFTPPAGRRLPLNPRAHYTLDNWTRLWVEEFFADDIGRVLYLDSDIVVLGSIAALWRADLGGALFGAVDIPGSQQGVDKLGMRAEDGYFNSGVLLIDLEQWRQTRALQTVLDYIEAYPERLVYTLDQDALNACFYDRRKRLDYRWNAIWPFFRDPVALPLTAAEIERVRCEARIIHFNGSLKPWSYFCDHPRQADYQRYLRMTEWRDFVPEDRTVLNRFRKQISAILPATAKRPLKALATRISAAARPGAKG
ncbi:MAG TPA: glycosyltransferase family 8 protein [Stellaceae bacterium]